MRTGEAPFALQKKTRLRSLPEVISCERQKIQKSRSAPLITFVLLFLFSSNALLHGNGIYRNGIGARAISIGGANAASPESALEAMAANPAALATLRNPELALGLTAAFAEGRFINRSNETSRLSTAGLLPDFAFSLPLNSDRFTLGISVIPEAVSAARWHYNDLPGGANGKTSYGFQEQHSEIFLLRSALGAGISLSEKLFFGLSLGLEYNENTLEAPFVFQSQPALKKIKTLLDLDTSGIGWNGQFGFLFRPTENLQIGLTYKTPTTISTFGDASGNASAQFKSLGLSGARPDFHYRAKVENHFPQIATIGLAWFTHPRWQFFSQVDWVNWRNAFDDLHVKLKNGNNSDINGIVGANSLEDVVPLHWQDCFIYRFGVEVTATKNLLLRAGYSYGTSPVPNETLTPLTAAISEHSLAFGLGYHFKKYQFDLGYQWDLPAAQTVKRSVLQTGEYNNSHVELGAHWLTLTTSIKF